MEMEDGKIKINEKEVYGRWNERMNTPLGWWILQDKCRGLPLESSQLTQDKT